MAKEKENFQQIKKMRDIVLSIIQDIFVTIKYSLLLTANYQLMLLATIIVLRHYNQGNFYFKSI